MIKNFRDFEAGPDPFGRTWQVYFRWLQTGISIRHADTVDVKFGIGTSGEPFEERVIALSHPVLLALSEKFGHPLTDTWCMKLAAHASEAHAPDRRGHGEDAGDDRSPRRSIEYARELEESLSAKK